MNDWIIKEFDKVAEKEIIAQGKGKLLARLLAQRNVTPEETDNFLTTDYKKLTSPFKLNDMDKAVDIFVDIVNKNGTVAISADYDADGITSATIISELCENFGLKCKIFLPSRMEHGYGLNPRTIQGLKDMLKEPPDLLFVLDCGMNNKDEIEIIRNEIGVKKIIVIDHHLGEGSGISTNADALITWHLSEGHSEMCTAGEAFQFVRGVKTKLPNLNPIEFITYAAIGTVADMSPIVENNRIIVKNGLTSYAINHVAAAGLSALMRNSRIFAPTLTQEDISFKLAPKINATGRMYHPDIALGLLKEKDNTTADKIVKHVASCNDERKALQKKIEKEAAFMVKENEPTHGVFVADKEWHIGVVGIVASRLVEEFNKPAIVIGYHDGKWKGSGRSIPGINVKHVLDSCSEMFVAYGGHAAAVGMQVKEEYIDKAAAIFDKACTEYYKEHKVETPKKLYDANLGVKLINMDIAKALRETLYPYCKDLNQEPIFKVSDVTVTNAETKKGPGWTIFKFWISKDGYDVEYPFKIFTEKFGNELKDQVVDVYFSFPQLYELKPNMYSEFELSAIDVIKKD